MKPVKQIGMTIIVIVAVLWNASCKIAGYQVISVSEKDFRTLALYPEPDNRPLSWAKAINKSGLPNLHKVNDNLYRGAQPKKQGYQSLKKMGIKTIIDLTQSGKDRKVLPKYSFKYFQVPLTASTPNKKDYEKVLNLLKKPELQPIFLHCRYGADRTGAMMALYRIKYENWSRHDALVEMVLGGYHFHKKYGKPLTRFVSEFQFEKE